MLLDLYPDLNIYYSARGFSHISSSLRLQEGSGVAKKNPWQALCLGGDPLKTRCAPHLHRFCFLLLFFLHSWHASCLAPLSFHASLSRLHTHACHFPTPTSEASLEQQGHDVDSRLHKTPSARTVICHNAICCVDRAVLINKIAKRCFHLAWDYKVVRSQHPRLVCHHRQKMTRSLMGGQREQHANDLKSSSVTPGGANKVQGRVSLLYAALTNIL